MARPRSEDGTVYLRGGIYWASWYENGKRRNFSTHKTKLKDAENVAYTWARGFAVPEEKSSHTLRGYAASFFTADCPRAQRMRDEGRPPGARWQRSQRAWLEKHVLTDEIADMQLARITRGKILDFRNRLRKRLPDKLNTINKAMATLATILSEAAFREDIAGNPAAKVGNIKEDRQERGTFTEEELEAMFPGSGIGPWADLEDYTFFCLAAETGMRRGELMALKWSAIDFEAANISIELAWKGGHGQYGLPKSGKLRTYPLPAYSAWKLAELRDRALPPSPWVFRDALGAPRGETWVQKHFTAAMAKLKIDTRARRLSPHCFRHTAATLLIANGANPEQVRAAFGWCDPKIQARYSHIQSRHMKDISAVLAQVVRHPVGARA